MMTKFESKRGLCRFAGAKGMRGEGSARGCALRHEAAGLMRRREETPQPLAAPYDARLDERPLWASRSDAKRRSSVQFRKVCR